MRHKRGEVELERLAQPDHRNWIEQGRSHGRNGQVDLKEVRTFKPLGVSIRAVYGANKKGGLQALEITLDKAIALILPPTVANQLRSRSR
jgi:hypothetical protein